MSIEEDGITAKQQMASSCVGSLLVSVFMTPLDVVKIRLQTQERFFSKKCFLYSNGITDHLLPRVNGDPLPMALHNPEEICNCRWYNRPKYFNGTFDAFVKISKVEGFTSLWSGLSPTLVLAVPTTVIYFTTYEQIKEHARKSLGLTKREAIENTALSMSAGALSRIWAVTIVSPLELIRTKMQSQKMAFYQVRQALAITVESQGVLGLWRGYSATLLRDVPFSAIYWPCYEFLRPKSYNFVETFLAGAAAGTAACALTLPMDVIKTRFQIELGEKMITSSANGSTMTNLSVAKEILAKEGVSGLFTGLVPRILKVAPACAIMIASYEYCKRIFSERNAELRLQQID